MLVAIMVCVSAKLTPDKPKKIILDLKQGVACNIDPKDFELDVSMNQKLPVVSLANVVVDSHELVLFR